MKNLKSIFLLALVALFTACATSNDVVSNGLIQKRKYRKGFYFEKNANGGSSTKAFEEDIADNNTIVESEKEFTKTENEILESKVEDEESSEVKSTDLNEAVNNEIAISKTDEHTYFLPKKKDIRDFSKPSISIQRDYAAAAAAESGAMLVLLIILCLIIPPLAIGIYQGITTWFWIDLILFLLAATSIGIGLGLGLSGAAGLAAVIIAFLVIFDVI